MIVAKPFFFLLIFFPGSFFSRLRFWLFPPFTFWFRSSVGSRSISTCSSLSAQSPDPARASPQTVNLPVPGNKQRSPALQKAPKGWNRRSGPTGPSRPCIRFCRAPSPRTSSPKGHRALGQKRLQPHSEPILRGGGLLKDKDGTG